MTRKPSRPKKRKKSQAGPRLSLCMIVRDNYRTIQPCLQSIRPWVDEVIVVDTGSVDDTPKIARELGAKVSTFAWCDDFSAARNVSLARARGEWLFWMDSDDTIPQECGRRLRQLVDGPHAERVLGYVMQVHCPGPADGDEPDMTVVDHVKLIRNRPELRFEGRIHEQIIPAIRRQGGEVAWTDIYVVHSGSEQTAQGKQKKYERDLRLLSMELAENPRHPFHLFNMGMTFNDMGNHEEAVSWLRQALQAAAPHESHVRKVYALLVGSLTSLGRLEEALELCQEGRRHYPLDVELLFRLGIVLHGMGQLPEAVAAYRSALQTREEQHFASIDPAIKNYKSRHNLAVVYSELEQHALAELQWRLIVERQPRRRTAWHQLGECLLRQGKVAGLEHLMDAMSASRGLQLERSLLEAAWALALGKKEQAQTCLHRLQASNSDDVRVARLKCRYDYDHGTLEESQKGLEDFLARHGEEPATLHNLGEVYYRQGALGLAADALRRSLVLRPDAPQTGSRLEEVERRLAQGDDAD